MQRFHYLLLAVCLCGLAIVAWQSTDVWTLWLVDQWTMIVDWFAYQRFRIARSSLFDVGLFLLTLPLVLWLTYFSLRALIVLSSDPIEPGTEVIVGCGMLMPMATIGSVWGLFLTWLL